ncbi:MAG: AsmA family protein [Woeseiaceae bacterium]
MYRSRQHPIFIIVMRWIRWILISVSVVVVLLGTALLLLLTVDLGRFKSNFEHFVSDSTGREFVIAGRFEPSIGKTIDVVAEDVRLVNADWGVAANILELERVVVSVDTWSLFSGPIDVINLEVEGLALHVEKKPDTQRSSWSFGDSTSVEDDIDDDGEPFELPLWLDQARLQRISVTYGQGWLDAPRSISISDANFSSDERDLLTMKLAGAVGDDPIAADGLIGPLSALLDGKGPRWELEATVGQFLASTEGSFRDLFRLEGPDIHAAMQGPSAERALARFGLPALARGPVDIKLDIADDPDGVEFHVEGEFGDLTTDIVGQAQSVTAVDDLEFSVDVRGPNLRTLGELFDAGFLPPTEFVVAGGITTSGGTLRTESLVITAGDARLKIDGKLAPAAVDPDARLNLLASGPALSDFLPPSLAERIPSGAFDIHAIAAGRMQRPRLEEFKGSIDGDAFTFELVDATVDVLSLFQTPLETDGISASIDLGAENLRTLLEPWVEVEIPELPFSIEGEVTGSNSALTLSNVAYGIGSIRGTLDGTTGTLPSLDGLRLNNSLTGPDLNELRELLADPDSDLYIPAADFETHNTLSKTSAGWFVDSSEIRIGESHFELQGALGDFENAAGIDIDFQASGPDLRLYNPDSNIDVPVPYQFSGGMKFGETMIELRDVNLRVAETTAWLDGRLPTSEQLMNAEFDVRIAGPNLERLGKALGYQGLPDKAFRIEGHMNRFEQSYRVDKLNAAVGDNDVSGELGLDFADKLRITGQLESQRLNLTDLFGDEDDEDDERSAAGAPPPDRLIPDTPLPLDLLDIADLDVTLHLHQFDGGYFDVGAVELTAVAGNDELHIDTSRVSLTHGGTLNGSLDIARTADDRADVQISATATQFEFRPPVDRDGASIDRPPKDMELELSGSGRTIRELAAGANGSIALRVGKGELDNELRGLLLRDFLKQLLSAINPLTKESKRTNLNCGFLALDVVDGMATSRALGFQTDQLAVASLGTIDLKTEALDLVFRVKQREGVGISLAGVINPYIKVAGTLASPALRIDTKRGLVSGTFAVLTGGLSILAKGAWDRYLSQDNYCEAVLEALETGEIPAWEKPATNEE